VGSALAGAKAGAFASLYFAGSISLFNILLLFSFKNQALSYLATNFQSCSNNGPATVAGTAEYCFSNLIFPGVPLYDFARSVVVALLFAVAMGLYFDYLPGPTYIRRTLLVALIMLVAMLFLDLFGIVTSQLQEVLMITFEGVAAVVYALIMARLYRSFTREVEFQTIPSSGKVVVDSRDLTGKRKTFMVNSEHKVKAAGELKTFKGWLVSGGVTVKEPKQPETSILIGGDGLLKLA
jgi:hypothetical protein